MEETDSLSRFASFALRPDAEMDLGEGALLVAASQEPGVDVDAGLGRLDDLAEQVRPAVERSSHDLDRLLALNRGLYDELGFRGNVECYYDPRNSLLHRVLERRLGIPISLALVLVEVGRRVGVPLVGVGMPCHFLVRHALHPQLLVDPFFGGRLLDDGGCAALLRSVSGGRIRFRPELLRAVGARRFLLRMIANLRGIHLQQGRVERALALVELQRLLAPDDPGPLRDEAVLRLRLGQGAAAADLLRRSLASVAEPEERAALEHLLARARALGARWN